MVITAKLGSASDTAIVTVTAASEEPRLVIGVKGKLTYKLDKKIKKLKVSDKSIVKVKKSGKKIKITGKKQGTATVIAYGKKKTVLGSWTVKVE